MLRVLTIASLISILALLIPVYAQANGPESGICRTQQSFMLFMRTSRPGFDFGRIKGKYLIGLGHAVNKISARPLEVRDIFVVPYRDEHGTESIWLVVFDSRGCHVGDVTMEADAYLVIMESMDGA